MENKNESPQTNWKLMIFILFLGWTVIWISRTVLNPVLPSIKASLSIATDTQLSLVFSSYFLAYTIIQFPAGALSDRFGEKLILVPSFLIFALSTLIMGFAHSVQTLYIANFFSGLTSGVFFACSYSLSIKMIPLNRRTFSNAVINSGTAIGMGAGMIGSTFLSLLGLDWRTLLFITAALIASTLIVFIKFLPSTLKRDKSTLNVTTKKIPFLKLFNKQLIVAAFAYFTICYGYYMLATWLPNFLQTERGITGMMIGYIAAISAFAALPGAIIFARISDRFNQNKTTIIVVLIFLAALFLYLSAEATSQIWLFIALIGYGFFGKLAIDPIIVSYVAEITTPENYGLTFGLFNFFGMLGSVLSPYFTAVSSDLTGSKVFGFYFAALLMIFGGITLWYVTKKPVTAR
ncbi:MFS transporter [Carnobacterium gallinarum]|uniref:MFS transporter n=1 Tax=Carnobacterium gallinarum TaxID=2749 RepID=UPI0005518638|nr:MFS transporter [Carnobacterium gallinarum]